MENRSWKQTIFDGVSVTTLRYGAIVACVFFVSAAIVISVFIRSVGDAAERRPGARRYGPLQDYAGRRPGV